MNAQVMSGDIDPVRVFGRYDRQSQESTKYRVLCFQQVACFQYDPVFEPRPDDHITPLESTEKSLGAAQGQG
jgi:hypothetical protein